VRSSSCAYITGPQVRGTTLVVVWMLGGIVAARLDRDHGSLRDGCGLRQISELVALKAALKRGPVRIGGGDVAANIATQRQHDIG
jgi:hypothetical protein